MIESVTKEIQTADCFVDNQRSKSRLCSLDFTKASTVSWRTVARIAPSETRGLDSEAISG